MDFVQVVLVYFCASVGCISVGCAPEEIDVLAEKLYQPSTWLRFLRVTPSRMYAAFALVL